MSNLYSNHLPTTSTDFLEHEKVKNNLFSEADIQQAVKDCNFNKALGEDWFHGELLNDQELGPHLRRQLQEMLNQDEIPDYLKIAKLVLISKTGKTSAKLDEIRPISVLSHVTKVLEKAIKAKLDSLKSNLLTTGGYQSGFKKGHSTANNLSAVLNEILRTRTKRSERKIYLAIDLVKAYDSVDRKMLFGYLDTRAKTTEDRQLLNLIKSLYRN